MSLTQFTDPNDPVPETARDVHDRGPNEPVPPADKGPPHAREAHDIDPNEPVPAHATLLLIRLVILPVPPKRLGAFTVPVNVGLASGASPASVVVSLLPVGPSQTSGVKMEDVTANEPRHEVLRPVLPNTTHSPYTFTLPTAADEFPIRMVML